MLAAKLPQQGFSEGSPMQRKAYLKEPYFHVQPRPFTALDYVLCVVAFFLSGIAFVPELTRLLLPVGK